MPLNHVRAYFSQRWYVQSRDFSEEQKIDIWKVTSSSVAGIYRKVILSIFSTETLAPATLLIVIYSGARV